MSPPREPTIIKVPINEFKVSSLPASVKSKWEPFGREPGQTDKRAHALKDATYRIYRAIEVGFGIGIDHSKLRTGGPQLYRIHPAVCIRGMRAALVTRILSVLAIQLPRNDTWCIVAHSEAVGLLAAEPAWCEPLFSSTQHLQHRRGHASMIYSSNPCV
jgi:hypothetical protein